MLEVYQVAIRLYSRIDLILESLFVGIILRQIKNENARKWTSTLFGIYLLVIFFQEQFIQYFIFVNFTVICIFISGPKTCHLVSSLLTLTYITVFRIIYYDLLTDEYFQMTLVIMAFTSKMIGLGIDIHFASNQKIPKDDENNTESMKTLNFWDLFHFAFCYVGVFVGLFYRYRTYEDFIKRPFSRNFKDYAYIRNRIIMTLAFIGIFTLISAMYFPTNYILEDGFKLSGFWYKTLYGYMIGMGFRYWLYCNFVLGELINSVAGFGAYPVRGENKHGLGPSKGYQDLIRMSDKKAEREQCDMRTVQSVYYYKTLIEPWIRNVLYIWNVTYQYWFTAILKCARLSEYHEYGYIITMTIDTLWHGMYPGIIFPVFFTFMLISTMKDYWKVHKLLKGPTSIVYLVVMWIIKDFYAAQYGLSAMLYHMEDVQAYYSQVYYTPFIWMLLIFMLGRKLKTLYIKTERKNN